MNMNNLNLNRNYIKYFSSDKGGSNDKEWEKLLENMENDPLINDDLRNSIESIVASFHQLNMNLNQSALSNQNTITNITREEDDPNFIRNIEEDEIPSSNSTLTEQDTGVLDNTNLEGTGTIDAISSLATIVDVTEYNSNSILEAFSVEMRTNAPSLLRQHRSMPSTIDTNIPVIDLGEAASTRITETRETIEQTIIHFNNILKTKEILLNKMQKQHSFTAQNLSENIQSLTERTSQAYEQAQTAIDNIANPENLNLFTTIFNLFADHLPIRLITYCGTGLVALSLFLFVGKYVLKYNLLFTMPTSIAATPSSPPITVNVQPNTSHAGFFSRVGDRIIKLLDIFVDYLKNENTRSKYK